MQNQQQQQQQQKQQPPVKGEASVAPESAAPYAKGTS
jgi:hypothetical protein